MRYASTETFEGQRATIGRIVVLKDASGIGAGIVDHITDDGEVGIIDAIDGELSYKLKFSPTHTIGDVENMADGTWTWPPRV